MLKRANFRTLLVDNLYYVAGNVLYCLGIYTFARNAHFSPGGISGLALIVNHYTGWPIGLVTLALNIPLVLVAWRVVGLGFLGKTLWVMLLNTFFMDVVFPRIPSYSGNPLLAAMFTGAALGAGLALIYMRGASTGGGDFISMSVKKKRPHLSIGRITLCVDAVIILAGGFVFGNIDAVLYGMVASFATTRMMDNLLYGAGSGKLAIVITVKGQAIADAISVEVERGSTLVPATGAYTGEGREMLLCVCGKAEIYKVRTAARAIDPGSMIIVTEANEIFGEGFVPPPLPGNEEPREKRQR